MLRLQDGKKCNEEGMTHQDIAREWRAQRAFILQKQRMKKGKQAIEKKAKILEDQINAQKKYREFLSPKKKAIILEDDAAAHKQYWESLPLEKKAQILEDKVKAQK